MNLEFEMRISKLRNIIEEEDLDGVLIYSNMLRRENVRYFTNFVPLEPHACALFPRIGQPILMTPIRSEQVRAEATSWVSDVRSYDGDMQGITKVVKELKISRRLGIVGWSYIPSCLVLGIQESLSGLDLFDITSKVHHIRLIKSDLEIEKITQAARIADKVFEFLVSEMKPGMEEYRVIAMAEQMIRKTQGEDNFQLLASSDREARAMHPPSDKPLNPGDVFLTEISPSFQGYFAQICRTVVFGDVPDGISRAHEILRNAQQRAIDGIKPGISASDAAKLQNDVFRENGFDEFVTQKYTRGRGHGIGLYIDEEPLIAEGNEYILEEGMVVMIHPNTYLPISGYIVLGDPVLIEKSGGRRLNRSTRELISIA